jgi:predicted ATP-dependent endonuclease of OLD family
MLTDATEPYRQFGVLGASFRGSPPIGVTHLPFTEGLLAMYGKNGAGKSRLLDALRPLLAGKASEHSGWLHLRLDETDLAYGASVF